MMKVEEENFSELTSALTKDDCIPLFSLPLKAKREGVIVINSTKENNGSTVPHMKLG